MNCLEAAILVFGCLVLPPAVVAQSITPISSSGDTNGTTGRANDLAILGPGYFVVRDPDENILYVTRKGDFRLDSDGHVISSCGLRLQGFTNPALTEIGDLRIDSWVGPSNANLGMPVRNFTYQSDGRLLIGLADGTEYVRGQVLLQNFGCSSKLRKMGDGYYALEQAALPLSQPLPPGTTGHGALASGQLEVLAPTLELSRLKAQASPSAQGVLYSTWNETDLAIEGRGFFIVRDPANNVIYATRAGAFCTDTNGYLVNYAGMRVQGYTNAASSGIGDVQTELIGLPPGADPTAADVIGVWVNHFGKISTSCANGTTLRGGQILLRDCAQPGSLLRTNFGLYPLVEASGLWTGMTSPGCGGLGWVFSAMIETSQLDESILSARRSLKFFAQGQINQTNSPTALAISGFGLFIVRDPGSNLQYATRCGAFHLDAGGYLMTSNGFRVQGLADSGLSVPGDILINPDGPPNTYATNVTVAAYLFGCDGKITVMLSDGSSFTRGQILLQWFRNPQALRLGADQLYSNLAEAVPVFSNCAPGANGVGRLESYALEDLTPEPELQLPPVSGFRLLVSNPCGISSVETSSDCAHWTSVGQISDSGVGETEWFDTDTTLAPCRFYRVRTPPLSSDP